MVSFYVEGLQPVLQKAQKNRILVWKLNISVMPIIVSFILQIQSVFPSSVSDDVPAQGSSPVWIIVAIAAVVVIGGAIVLIAVLKRKRV